MDSAVNLKFKKANTLSGMIKAGNQFLVETNKTQGDPQTSTFMKNTGKVMDGAVDKLGCAEDYSKFNFEAQDKMNVEEASNLSQFLALEEFSTSELKRSRYVELENAKLFANNSIDNLGNNAVRSNSSYLSEISIDGQKRIAEGLRDAQSLAKERSRQLGLALSKLEKWMVRVSAKKRSKTGNQPMDRDSALTLSTHGTTQTAHSNQQSSSSLPPFPSSIPPALSDSHSFPTNTPSATLIKKSSPNLTMAGKRGANFEGKRDSVVREALDGERTKNSEQSTPNKKIRSTMIESRENVKQVQKNVWSDDFHSSPKPTISAPSSSEGHTDSQTLPNVNGVEMKILKGKRTRIKPDTHSANVSSEIISEKVQLISNSNDVKSRRAVKGENGDEKKENGSKVESKGVKTGAKMVIGKESRALKSDLDDTNACSEDKSIPVNSTSRENSHDLSPEHNSKAVTKVKASRSQRSNPPLNSNTQITLQRSSSSRHSLEGLTPNMVKHDDSQTDTLNKKRQMKSSECITSPSSSDPTVSFRPQKAVKLLNSQTFSSGLNKNERRKDGNGALASREGSMVKVEKSAMMKQASTKRNMDNMKVCDDRKGSLNAKGERVVMKKESTEVLIEKRLDEQGKRLIRAGGKNAVEDKSKKKMGIGDGGKEEKGFGGSGEELKSIKSFNGNSKGINNSEVNKIGNVLKKTSFQRSTSSSMRSSYDDGIEIEKKNAYEEERMSVGNETDEKGNVKEKKKTMDQKKKEKAKKSYITKDRLSLESELGCEEEEEENEEEAEVEEAVGEEEEVEEEEEEEEEEIEVEEGKKDRMINPHSKVTASFKKDDHLIHRFNRSKRRMMNSKPNNAYGSKNEKIIQKNVFDNLKHESKNESNMEKGEKNSVALSTKTCEDSTVRQNLTDQDNIEILNIFREVIKHIIDNGGKFTICPNQFLKETESFFANVSTKEIEFLNQLENAASETDIINPMVKLSQTLTSFDHLSNHINTHQPNRNDFDQSQHIIDFPNQNDVVEINHGHSFKSSIHTDVEKFQNHANSENNHVLNELENYSPSLSYPPSERKSTSVPLSQLLLSALIDIPHTEECRMDDVEEDEVDVEKEHKNGHGRIRIGMENGKMNANASISSEKVSLRKFAEREEGKNTYVHAAEDEMEEKRGREELEKGEEEIRNGRKDVNGDYRSENGFLVHSETLTTKKEENISQEYHLNSKQVEKKGKKNVYDACMEKKFISQTGFGNGVKEKEEKEGLWANGVELHTETVTETETEMHNQFHKDTETKIHNIRNECNDSRESNLDSRILMELHSIGIVIENAKNFGEDEKFYSKLNQFENELIHKAQENKKKILFLKNKIEIDKEKREIEKEILNRLMEIAYFFQLGSKTSSFSSSPSLSLPNRIFKLHSIPKTHKMCSLFTKNVLEIAKKFEEGSSLFDIKIIQQCMETMNKIKSQSQLQNQPQIQNQGQKSKSKVKAKSMSKEEREMFESDDVENVSTMNRQTQVRPNAEVLGKVKKSNAVKQGSFREKVSTKINDSMTGSATAVRKSGFGMVQTSKTASGSTCPSIVSKDSKKEAHSKKKNSFERERERNLKVEEDACLGPNLPSANVKRKRSDRDSEGSKGGSKKLTLSQKASFSPAQEVRPKDERNDDRTKIRFGKHPLTASLTSETPSSKKLKHELSRDNLNNDIMLSRLGHGQSKATEPRSKTWIEPESKAVNLVENDAVPVDKNPLDAVDLGLEMDLRLVGAEGDLKWLNELNEDAALLSAGNGGSETPAPFDFGGGLACPMDDLSEIGFY